MVSNAVQNVDDEEQNTHEIIVRTAHVQKSPSGNTMDIHIQIKCDGISGYHNTKVTPTRPYSGTRAESGIGEKQSNNLGNPEIDKSSYHPVNIERGSLGDEVSKTKFWNHIDNGLKELERLNLIRENQRTKWVQTLPENAGRNLQNSTFELQDIGTGKLYFSPDRLDTGHSRGRKGAVLGEENANDYFSSIDNVAGTSKPKSLPSRNTSQNRLDIPKEEQVANWVQSLPDNTEINAHNSHFRQQASQNVPGTNQQNPSPERPDIGRSSGRNDEKSKGHRGEETSSPEKDNNKKSRKKSEGRDRKESKTRHHSRDRGKSDRKDEKKSRRNREESKTGQRGKKDRKEKKKTKKDIADSCVVM
jgi:hypothetical protein